MPTNCGSRVSLYPDFLLVHVDERRLTIDALGKLIE